MSRRKLLMYGGGAAAVLGGGWLALGQLGGASGPAGRVKAFFQALNEGNVKQANEMLHSQGEMTEIPGYVSTPYEMYDISVQSTNVTEKSDKGSTVEVKLLMKGPMGESSQTETYQVELRKENGTWKIYDPNLM